MRSLRSRRRWREQQFSPRSLSVLVWQLFHAIDHTCGQSWSMACKSLCLTYDETSLTAPGHTYGKMHERAAIRGRRGFVDWIVFLSSVAGFAETASGLKTYSMVTLARAESFEAPSERDFRGHDFKLRHRSFPLHRRKAASSVRLRISWNKLPIEIVNSPMLDTFKRLLDLAWFSMLPSLPWLPCSLIFYLTWFEAPTSAIVFDQEIWFD